MRDISELPEEAVQVLIREHVEAFDLSWNCLQALPREFCFCAQLHRLDLGNNRLDAFPVPLLRLSALTTLDLR